jgi:adenylate cyclase
MSAEKRRLAGILAADVVGYSAMVATDELATLACVRALRAEIIEPAAAAHDGRLFKTICWSSRVRCKPYGVRSPYRPR